MPTAERPKILGVGGSPNKTQERFGGPKVAVPPPNFPANGSVAHSGRHKHFQSSKKENPDCVKDFNNRKWFDHVECMDP